MKKLVFLSFTCLFVCLFVKIPTEVVVRSQVQKNKGSIVGFVYARDQGNGKSSVLVGVENRCPNDQPCDDQTIDKVTVSIDDKRLTESQQKTGNIGGLVADQSQKYSDEEKNAVKKAVKDFLKAESQWALRSYNGRLIPANDFAAGWDDKWAVNVSYQGKNKSTVTYSDKDPATSEFGYYARMDYNLPVDYVLKQKFSLNVSYQGNDLYNETVKPYSLPQLSPNVEKGLNCLNSPPAFYPGKNSYASIYLPDLVGTYKNNYYSDAYKGDFSTFRTPLIFAAYLTDKSGGNIRWIPRPQIEDQTESAVYEYLKVILPQTAKQNDLIKVIGINAYGEVFTYANVNETLILPADGLGRCSPGINNATRFIFEGRRLCVCGCFVDEDVWDLQKGLTVFTLDGKRVVPNSLSPNTATFFIPEGTAPGLHKIGYTHPDDDRFVQELEFRVLRLSGNINQNALLRLETTEMTLQIFGTEEKLPIRISYDPGEGNEDVIRISEGNVQTAITDGGTSNWIKRNVTGVRVGKFVINYEVDEARCPCLADYYPRASE